MTGLNKMGQISALIIVMWLVRSVLDSTEYKTVDFSINLTWLFLILVIVGPFVEELFVRNTHVCITQSSSYSAVEWVRMGRVKMLNGNDC